MDAGRVVRVASRESRQDFRNFLLDQIEQITVLQNSFRDKPDKSLAQFLRQTNDRLKG